MPDENNDYASACLFRAQALITESMRALADAQKHTDEKVPSLADVMRGLAEAQQRSDERMDALIAVVDGTARERKPPPAP